MATSVWVICHSWFWMREGMFLKCYSKPFVATLNTQWNVISVLLMVFELCKIQHIDIPVESENYSLQAHLHIVKYVCIDPTNNPTKHAQRVTRHPVFHCCTSISFSKHRRIIAHVHTAHLTCKNWQQCNNASIIVSRINGLCISQIIFTTFPTWLLLPTNLMITTGWFVYNNILCSKRANVLTKANSPKY